LLYFIENDLTEQNGVWDVLPGSEFCVWSYLYTKTFKKPLKTLQT